ncbi:kinase [Bacillus lacus]|uniref:Kinase n=1 Tax=Metabacillus lacus TaxID=1983721 RepID=A0A7X2J1G4_9BACI|nr:kinase-associated lipoprotein B [Metabacillus lacus]MRX73586.1 kinase [Metabacillus lacus]
MADLNIGEIVTGIYKTGKYVGEITAVKPQHYLVKVKAVLKHPQQGDLHMPKQAEVPLFHQRRALALHEQTNIPANMVKKFEGPVPDYQESLLLSLKDLKDELSNLETDWAEKSLRCLEDLASEYQ